METETDEPDEGSNPPNKSPPDDVTITTKATIKTSISDYAEDTLQQTSTIASMLSVLELFAGLPSTSLLAYGLCRPGPYWDWQEPIWLQSSGMKDYDYSLTSLSSEEFTRLDSDTCKYEIKEKLQVLGTNDCRETTWMQTSGEGDKTSPKPLCFETSSSTTESLNSDSESVHLHSETLQSPRQDHAMTTIPLCTGTSACLTVTSKSQNSDLEQHLQQLGIKNWQGSIWLTGSLMITSRENNKTPTNRPPLCCETYRSSDSVGPDPENPSRSSAFKNWQEYQPAYSIDRSPNPSPPTPLCSETCARCNSDSQSSVSVGQLHTLGNETGQECSSCMPEDLIHMQSSGMQDYQTLSITSYSGAQAEQNTTSQNHLPLLAFGIPANYIEAYRLLICYVCDTSLTSSPANSQIDEPNMSSEANSVDEIVREGTHTGAFSPPYNRCNASPGLITECGSEYSELDDTDFDKSYEGFDTDDPTGTDVENILYRTDEEIEEVLKPDWEANMELQVVLKKGEEVDFRQYLSQPGVMDTNTRAEQIARIRSEELEPPVNSKRPRWDPEFAGESSTSFDVVAPREPPPRTPKGKGRGKRSTR